MTAADTPMWLRLRQIALVTDDLRRVVDDLRAVFGLEVGHVDPGVEGFGLENSILPVGTQFLEVVAPIRDGTAGGRYLQRRGGDGGYMVIAQCDDHEPRRRRVADLGIRTVVELDRGEYRCMQLHPKDTGGSFLEIDWQQGADPDGAWWPAGAHWREAVRTDVVSAITAVEIQSPVPRALAERWSEILEAAARSEQDGSVSITPGRETIRFVDDVDGRGEGLGGVDLLCVDRERAVAAARERGLPVSGDVVTLCGTRFRLVRP